MTSARNQLLSKLWRGRDPFADFPRNTYPVDHQGWGSDHPFLVEHIGDGPVSVIAEVGVWKGGSTIAMARKMKELGIDGVVIAVDTWLGAADHWTNDEWFGHLGFSGGYPTLQRTLMANVLDAGVEDYVLPLPLDSLNAAEVLRHFGISLDILHIDAGHEYASVISDLKSWWPLLREGGLLLGDDYYSDGGWPGVKQAFDEFLTDYLPLEHAAGKARLRKHHTLSMAV